MIYIGADNHGYGVIQMVMECLKTRNLDFKNLGVTGDDKDMTLEVLIPRVVKKVLSGKDILGILSCGTGVGVEVGANKFGGIRACLATDAELAKWSRVYDDCNILCLVGWNANRAKTFDIVEAWLEAEYDGNYIRRKMLTTFATWH